MQESDEELVMPGKSAKTEKAQTQKADRKKFGFSDDEEEKPKPV